MKSKKIWFCLCSLMVVVFLTSCTTGQYMSIKSKENVEILGTVNTTFVITGSFRYRSVINTQAYMHLLEEARKEYQGNIDMRDITWVIGKGDSTNNNYEYSAMGKVIRQ